MGSWSGGQSPERPSHDSKLEISERLPLPLEREEGCGNELITTMLQ